VCETLFKCNQLGGISVTMLAEASLLNEDTTEDEEDAGKKSFFVDTLIVIGEIQCPRIKAKDVY